MGRRSPRCACRAAPKEGPGALPADSWWVSSPRSPWYGRDEHLLSSCHLQGKVLKEWAKLALPACCLAGAESTVLHTIKRSHTGSGFSSPKPRASGHSYCEGCLSGSGINRRNCIPPFCAMCSHWDWKLLFVCVPWLSPRLETVCVQYNASHHNCSFISQENGQENQQLPFH